MQVLQRRADLESEDIVPDADVDLTVTADSSAVVVRIPPRAPHDPDRLVHALSEATATPVPVVVDLRHSDPGTEVEAVASVEEAARRLGVEWCVVSTRRRPVKVPQRPGGSPALFATARDALQALVLARQGYGPGWSQR